MQRMTEQQWVRRNCAILQHEGKLADPNERYYDGLPLFHALLISPPKNADQLSCLKKLMEQGCDANIPDWAGVTPLMLASQRAQRDVIKFLGTYDAVAVEAEDRRGNTALCHAVHSGSLPTVRLALDLVESRDLFRLLVQRNKDGKSAVDIAADLKRTDIEMILAERQKFRHALAPSLSRFHARPDTSDTHSTFLPASTVPHPPDGLPKSRSAFMAPDEKILSRSSSNDSKLGRQVAVATKVHGARKRFLSVIGVFHDK